MAKVTNSLVTKQMPWHANMTELNHLGAALIAKPHVFEGKMDKLFTSQMYSDNSMTTILKELGAEETIGKSEWEWQLKGANERPLVVIENVEPVSNTQLGSYKSTFKLKLDENWFVAGDILTPGAANKKYQVRIQENPVRHGNGWVYIVRGMWDDDATFLPQTYVSSGTKWGKLYAQYEEGGEQSGSTQYSLPLSLANRMSRFRKHFRITGDAAQEVLAVQIPDSKGTMHKSWVKYSEVEFWQQWYRELERGAWYSRSSKTIDGSTGRPIYSGPGIQEQLEDSHIHNYSHLTAKLIEEYLMDIFYSRVKPGTKRKIKVFTGEYGMLTFNRAMQDLLEKKGWMIANSNFNPVQKTKSEYNDNAYSVGYQFVKYIMQNGAELELVHNPLYDDKTINFEIDPVTGYPVESMRFTFLDFSGDAGSSNIKIMNKADSLKLGYINGLQTPFGPVNNGAMAHSGDYYEMHVAKQCGIHINDVGRCGELILKRVATV